MWSKHIPWLDLIQIKLFISQNDVNRKEVQHSPGPIHSTHSQIYMINMTKDAKWIKGISYKICNVEMEEMSQLSHTWSIHTFLHCTPGHDICTTTYLCHHHTLYNLNTKEFSTGMRSQLYDVLNTYFFHHQEARCHKAATFPTLTIHSKNNKIQQIFMIQCITCCPLP